MTHFKQMALGVAGVLLCVSHAQAKPIDECIDAYEAQKAQFESISPDGEYECVELDNSLNLYATGAAPLGCKGEAEWHLEAQSVDGEPGRCSVRILGHSDAEECNASRVKISLAKNEAQQWQNHLRKECRDLAKTHKIRSKK